MALGPLSYRDFRETGPLTRREKEFFFFLSKSKSFNQVHK